MGDVVSIDVARVRAAARAMRASSEALGGPPRAIAGCGFGASGPNPARAQAVREGYLRLARAIGVWSSASDVTARALAETADAYERQDVVTGGNVVALGGR
ncbi:N-acyl-D-amino-acid deacylase [Rhodococcus sp. SGAir0479]|uniref:N-acyl-D-amino-acid deacylase n=1 Tax=Rhodococcus sp. SGAir0479 TaxID=2567884 RepID=UPI0010CD448F|nr:N-acyl-D-amino-acid deacylase [Rhodococcus sp. SGAir0479]QCQ92145.1 N-acyl-D-amino-acid deacylase [Rhodococcus sp. SGAir0479]